MALIKTIAEVKEVLPKLVSNLNSDKLMPNFDEIEIKHLVPIIGMTLYNGLCDRYKNGNLTDSDKALLKHIRLLIAAYGYSENLIASHVVISDQGVRTTSTEDMPKAVGWEYKELKAFLYNKALDGTEVLLTYLWANKANLADWTVSDEYKKFEGLLIKTGADFNDQYGLHQPMRTFYALKSIIRDQQENYLVSGIGSELVTYLVKKANPSDDETAIINLLKKALANFSVKHACEKFAVRFTESGFTVVTEFGGDREGEDSGRSAATDNQVNELKKACDRDGKNFMLSAKRELVVLRANNAATEEFIAAFDSGRMKSYIDRKEKTSGNERRRIFRFR